MADAVAGADGQTPIRLEALVRGHVQGVGFRYFTVRAARSLGLSGWVANLPGGHVRCVAEGDRAALEAFEATLRDGPPGALVTDVAVTWRPADGEFRDFSIRSGDHPGD